MKKFMLSVMVVLGTTITGCQKNSTEVSSTKSNGCKCLICEACDSLDMACAGDSIAFIENIDGKKIPMKIHGEKFTQWYDSLTTLVVNDIQYHYDTEMTTAAFDAYIEKEYCGNPKFMYELEMGFDGLCGDCYDTHSEAIDEFYNVVNK